MLKDHILNKPGETPIAVTLDALATVITEIECPLYYNGEQIKTYHNYVTRQLRDSMIINQYGKKAVMVEIEG